MLWLYCSYQHNEIIDLILEEKNINLKNNAFLMYGGSYIPNYTHWTSSF